MVSCFFVTVRWNYLSQVLRFIRLSPFKRPAYLRQVSIGQRAVAEPVTAMHIRTLSIIPNQTTDEMELSCRVCLTSGLTGFAC